MKNTQKCWFWVKSVFLHVTKFGKAVAKHKSVWQAPPNGSKEVTNQFWDVFNGGNKVKTWISLKKCWILTLKKKWKVPNMVFCGVMRSPLQCPIHYSFLTRSCSAQLELALKVAYALRRSVFPWRHYFSWILCFFSFAFFWNNFCKNMSEFFSLHTANTTVYGRTMCTARTNVNNTFCSSFEVMQGSSPDKKH